MKPNQKIYNREFHAYCCKDLIKLIFPFAHEPTKFGPILLNI